MSRAQCEQLRGVISQAGSPSCQGPDWAGQEAQERPGAPKGHQQVGGRSGGGLLLLGIEKADLQGLLWAQSSQQTQRRMVDGRETQSDVGQSGDR